MNQLYIPHADGYNFDTCYLLDTSKQFKGTFLEEIEFFQELREELKKEETINQIENTIQIDAEIESIIKEAVAGKKSTVPTNVSKSEKIKGIRVNRQAEKIMNRKLENFDLVDKVNEKPTQVVEFTSKPAKSETLPKKSNSRLMEKLMKKRDEEFEKGN